VKPLPSGSSNQGEAACPDGKRVLGGGVTASLSSAVVFGSAPSNSIGSGWFGEVLNATMDSGTMTVYAICANVQ